VDVSAKDEHLATGSDSLLWGAVDAYPACAGLWRDLPREILGSLNQEKLAILVMHSRDDLPVLEGQLADDEHYEPFVVDAVSEANLPDQLARS
jgi:hypothetical protein